MLITSLKLQNFRNYDELKLDFNKDINVIYGDNAQGKTNILEAISVASIGKSFLLSLRQFDNSAIVDDSSISG